MNKKDEMSSVAKYAKPFYFQPFFDDATLQKFSCCQTSRNRTSGNKSPDVMKPTRKQVYYECKSRADHF